MNKMTYLWCIPLCFGVCLLFQCSFGLKMCNHCNSLPKTKSRLVIAIWQGPGPVTKKQFFGWNLNQLTICSALAQERNLPFLSARSAQYFCCDLSGTLPDHNDQPWLHLLKGVAVVMQFSLKVYWNNKQTPKDSGIQHRQVLFINFLEKCSNLMFLSICRSQYCISHIESLLFSTVICNVTLAHLALCRKITQHLRHVKLLHPLSS